MDSSEEKALPGTFVGLVERFRWICPREIRLYVVLTRRACDATIAYKACKTLESYYCVSTASIITAVPGDKLRLPPPPCRKVSRSQRVRSRKFEETPTKKVESARSVLRVRCSCSRGRFLDRLIFLFPV